MKHLEVLLAKAFSSLMFGGAFGVTLVVTAYGGILSGWRVALGAGLIYLAITVLVCLALWLLPEGKRVNNH